jgi:hypothetical protein
VDQYELLDMVGSGAAARRLGISTVHLRSLVVRGRVPAVETPLGLLFRTEDLDAYLRPTSEQRLRLVWSRPEGEKRA